MTNLTQSQILERPGWNKKLITTLLGKPDAYKKIYGYSQEAHLYNALRVVIAEKTDIWIQAQEDMAKRKQASIKAVQTKVDKIVDRIDNTTIIVKELPYTTIVKRAVGDGEYDKAYLDRQCVNYIRHELTGYDRTLDTCVGKTGKLEAYKCLRHKIFAEISRVYPMYAEECTRQLLSKANNTYRN